MARALCYARFEQGESVGAGLRLAHRWGEGTMKRKVAALIIAGGTTLGVVAISAGPASAAPITCPGPQVAVKTSSGWDCQNRPGNLSGAEDPKNPNAGKDKF